MNLFIQVFYIDFSMISIVYKCIYYYIILMFKNDATLLMDQQKSQIGSRIKGSSATKLYVYFTKMFNRRKKKVK